jgi:hypothetical protein
MTLAGNADAVCSVTNVFAVGRTTRADAKWLDDEPDEIPRPGPSRVCRGTDRLPTFLNDLADFSNLRAFMAHDNGYIFSQ